MGPDMKESRATSNEPMRAFSLTLTGDPDVDLKIELRAIRTKAIINDIDASRFVRAILMHNSIDRNKPYKKSR
jgi:hypothetical protein